MAATAETSSSPTTPRAQALHLQRGARPAARVDRRVRREGARAARRRVGGDDLRRLGLHAHGRARLPRPLLPGGVRRAGRRLLLQPRAGRGDRRKSNSGGLAMGIAVHTDMATPPIHLFGTEEQKQEYLVPAIKGEKISCLGITEPDAGSDVAGIKTRAVRDGDEYVINGSKTYITNGHRADFIVLVTKTDPDAGYDGFTLFLVDMDPPGVIREKKLEKLGMHASDTALLAFQDVRVPDGRHPRRGGQGLLPHHVGAPGRAADRRGGLRRGRAALLRQDAPVRAWSARRSAARSASSRSIRHKFAEMATKIESARQMVYTTAWRFQNGEYPVREISMAKLLRVADRRRGRRRVHPDPRRRRLHEGVRRRARLARHAPEPHRRRHRRDHARRDRASLRALGSHSATGCVSWIGTPTPTAPPLRAPARDRRMSGRSSLYRP